GSPVPGLARRLGPASGPGEHRLAGLGGPQRSHREMKAASCLLLFAAALAQASSHHSHAGEETLEFGRFGTVTLYRPTPHPANVVIFVSGDGGWNLGVVDMARELETLDVLVAGVDIRHYLKDLAAAPDKCAYPAADFENLSHFLQKKLDFPTYHQPVL